jgi:hypothetical protein
MKTTSELLPGTTVIDVTVSDLAPVKDVLIPRPSYATDQAT